MLRPYFNIQIQQVTPYVLDGVTISRSLTLNLDFACEYKIESSWENHTDTATLTFPKNVILKSGNFLFNSSGTSNVIIGGINNSNSLGLDINIAPLIMKGDKIIISDGYRFFNKANSSSSLNSFLL